MTNYEKIYWLTRLDAIGGLFTGVIIFASIALIGYYMYYWIQKEVDWDDDEAKAFRDSAKWFRRIAKSALIVGAIGSTFLPTRNEAILIMAGGKTMDYIQSDTSLSKIPYQTTAAISEYMEKYLKELKEEKKQP